jgi:hypothetical protein
MVWADAQLEQHFHDARAAVGAMVRAVCQDRIQGLGIRQAGIIDSDNAVLCAALI